MPLAFALTSVAGAPPAGMGRASMAWADWVMAAAPVNRPFNQPVDPRPVETITPLEDCVSLASPLRMKYRADACVLGPMNKSFTPYKAWPLFNVAFAMVTERVERFRRNTSGITFV